MHATLPHLDEHDFPPLTRRSVSTVQDITELHAQALAGRPIAVCGHCHGCTAGQGSSCGGALS